jgi:broad specificity phosphatase PhoE
VIGRWKGHAWRDIPHVFPGDLEAYLEHPQELTFADESLAELADRMASVARRLDQEHPHGDVVIVSHQDPIQSAVLKLTGSPLSGLHEGKLGPGAVVSLRPGPAWRVETEWDPGESPRFGEKPGGLRVLEPAGRPEGPTSA